MKTEKGLRFQGMGLAVSRDPFPALAQLSATGSLTIEIALRPLKIITCHLPYITSFVPEKGPPALVIGAWKRSLIVRLGRSEERGGKKYVEIGLGNALAPKRKNFLTVVSGPAGTALYLDGRRQREYPDLRLPAGEVPLGRLLLGNSPVGSGDWEGDILALAVYNRALTADEIAQNHAAWLSDSLPEPPRAAALVARYGFDEGSGSVARAGGGSRHEILIPAVFRPLRRTILTPPGEDTHLTRSYLKDILLNVLGFMPFGFFAMLALAAAPRLSERTKSRLVVASGFAFSLAIELTQVFLPARTSSLTDLGANTLGAALGVLAYFIIGERYKAYSLIPATP